MFPVLVMNAGQTSHLLTTTNSKSCTSCGPFLSVPVTGQCNFTVAFYRLLFVSCMTMP